MKKAMVYATVLLLLAACGKEEPRVEKKDDISTNKIEKTESNKNDSKKDESKDSTDTGGISPQKNRQRNQV